ERDGMIGNIYSMGLALQALEATGEFYAPREWDCAQAFSVVYEHRYSQPTAIAQVLPALVGKTYLEAAELDCGRAGTSPSPSLSLSPTLSSQRPLSPLSEASIEVRYSVVNNLRGPPFRCSTSVRVPRGSTLLKVLEAAEEKDPQNFSFRTEQTSWGPMVVSIRGLAANAEDRTYWQFFGGQDALQEGVGTYEPRDGEHIEAVFSTY
ncbi:IF factor, partial [Lophotis ruficrista]|nr:IF factor [Lophotis ruficrista]